MDTSSVETAPDGKYLGTISGDFVKVAGLISEASYQIRKAGFAFPIFPMARESQEVGQLLIDKHERQLDWNYYASYLDEFVERALVALDKRDQFQQVYKDPDEYCCLFVVDEGFTQFVFIPYPEN